jgi:hypothetical protein
VGLRRVAEDFQRGPGADFALGELAVEPVERPVEAIELWPRETRLGGGLVLTQRQQQFAS